MSNDRPLVGILFMLCFCLLAPSADAIAKILGQSLPIVAILLCRFVFQFLLLAPAVIATRRPWRLSGRPLRLTLWRTVLHIAGVGLMFKSLQYLPLADAIAIAFVMPFIMLLLGKYVLNEDVGLRRLLACVVGFIGTLMVIQPSFVSVGWPALLPLSVALIFALFMLVTRQIAKEIDPITLQAVSGFMATVILLPATLIGTAYGIQAFSLPSPSGSEWILLLALGLLGTFAHLFMTWALKYAPSTTLAPMQYLEIPFATTIGWLVFSDLPNGLVGVGILVTLAAGLYVIYREQANMRSPQETSQ
ncbi:MAG: DMT family transporter [Thalassovita sp.]